LKAIIISTGETVQAKYYRDLTHGERKESIVNWYTWDGSEIFIEPHKDKKYWRYRESHQVKIIEEEVTQ